MLGGQGSHSQLSALPTVQVEWENAELRGQLLGVTQERDSALLKSQGLQSKLESLEQVLKVRTLGRWREGGTGRKRDGKACALRGARGCRAESWCPRPFPSLAAVSFLTECLEHMVSEAPSS